MFQRKLLYHKGTDDSLACWSTNYVMGGAAFLSGILLMILFFRSARNEHNNLRFLIFLALHLFWFGFSSIFGGFVNQFYPHTEEYPGTPIGYKAFWRLTLMSR